MAANLIFCHIIYLIYTYVYLHTLLITNPPLNHVVNKPFDHQTLMVIKHIENV